MMDATRVLRAVYYYKEGCPLKDFLEDDEIADALETLASIMVLSGVPAYQEDEE